MAASFIRRKAAIMCHYPWAMIFLPLPRVVFFCFFSLLLSFKQHMDIYSEKKKPQPATKQPGRWLSPARVQNESKANAEQPPSPQGRRATLRAPQ